MKIFFVKDFYGTPYKVCLPLLYIVVFALLGVSYLGLSASDWSLEPKYYIYCNNPQGCVNEYYNSPACFYSEDAYIELCSIPMIGYEQHLGDKPSWIVSNLTLICLFFIGGFVVANTWFFNRELVKKVKLE